MDSIFIKVVLVIVAILLVVVISLLPAWAIVYLASLIVPQYVTFKWAYVILVAIILSLFGGSKTITVKSK